MPQLAKKCAVKSVGLQRMHQLSVRVPTGVVPVSIFEQFSSLHGYTLLLPEVRGAFPQPKRRASWQTSAFIVQWEALHWILGDISTPRAPIPRFSIRETSSHFAVIAVVPTKVPIGFCKKITTTDALEGMKARPSSAAS